jgi:hypothetical protein
MSGSCGSRTKCDPDTAEILRKAGFKKNKAVNSIAGFYGLFFKVAVPGVE